jgi:hypothetical protein
VAWALLLLLIAIPALRHASAPGSVGSGRVSVEQVPRTAPAIARTAAIAAVGFAVPAPIVVAVARPPAPPRAPTSQAGAPLAPLRL